ncbi:MAG: hypothetical protein II937_09935 [Bacteroidales bacterium]|nr:hypothetical protein [Bacteroidales bacterium]
MKLTDTQTQWLIRHFKHTKNDEIEAMLHISLSYLHRLARELGLKKTKEFMKKTQANAVAHAQLAIANEDEEAKERRRQQANQNRNPKCCFQKGGNPFAGKTPEQIAEINTRRKATWERTRKADEIRLNWGRERKTRFIFAKHPDPDKNQRLIKIRCYLRNRRKYNIQGRGGMLAIITSETQRSLKMEQQATKLGMIFRNE